MQNPKANLFSATGLAGLLVVLGVLAGVNSRVHPAPDLTTARPLVHLFEWPWADIAAECETFLGPQGYGAVQISPPQEHVILPDRGFPWWQRYQPVSYQLESRGGSRTELIDMVQRCRRAGVAIYADAVINHMAGFEAGVGSAGTEFTKYHYPGLYNPEDFNLCRQPITNYQDAVNVTQCELVGLADLDTGSDRVQRTIVNYLNELANLGMAGFRIDAAKHIPSEELGQILSQLRARHPADLYLYQEVIDPGTEAIRKQDYYANGQVIEFQYGQYVSEAFLGYNGQTLAHLQTLGESWGLAPSDQAVVFIDNHDKQRGHGGGGHYLTHRDGPLYTLANVFMLAFPYGRPQVMSSYAFEDSDQGPPTNSDGTTRPIYQHGQAACFGAWVCEHRWPAIAGMVAFRNITQPVFEITDWWSNGGHQIAFGRGTLGFVVINGETETLTHTWQTQLSPGRYCNVLTGNPAADGGSCQEMITVDRAGQFTATLEGLMALAIHHGARLP
ncbi:MAG TPA: alpha-amylase family protein [Leptolyngbyaceae cyanobacterium M65_K2018_010]|nr:alpha-amylase family protein [Leptolyngbyaceae cyanobacterium M65_K2018_010]